MDDRTLASALSWGRIAVGVLLFLAPASITRTWVGREAETPAGRALARGLGIRDIALGVGTLLALSHDEERASNAARGWLEASALADSGDAVATLGSWRHLPRVGRVLALAMAVSAAAVNARLAREQSAES